MTATPPVRASLPALRAAVEECRGCPLWRRATRAVFGEGRPSADLVLVGEQPGDVEDREGRPFVGPAGKLLDRALEQAGIERSRVYVTNAVKHFKWKTDRAGGKRRLHATPSWSEVGACLPWLEAELHAIRPGTIVCLGATAARAVVGSPVRIGEARGRPLPTSRPQTVVVTVHPSSILRAYGHGGGSAELEHFVADLAAAAGVSHPARCG